MIYQPDSDRDRESSLFLARVINLVERAAVGKMRLLRIGPAAESIVHGKQLQCGAAFRREGACIRTRLFGPLLFMRYSSAASS